jgi:hypothetical protein
MRHLSFAVALAAALVSSGCDLVTGFLSPPPVVDDGGRGRDNDDNDDDDGDACNDDRDCNGGEVCVDDVCVTVCDSDRDCAGGEFCDGDGRCRAPDCVDDSGCNGGFGCVDFVCVALAEGEGEEGEGEEGEGEEGEGEEGEGEGGEGEGEAAGLRIELTWSTNDDDVDVHLTRAAPPAFCTADDCSYRNKVTTWGARMDIDDTDGFGPEQISATSLDDGSYTVLVDAFTVETSTTATLAVFSGGALVFERSKTLRDGDHWLVGRVDVDAGAVDVVDLDRVARQQGSCLGPAPASNTSCSTDASCSADEFCNASGRCAVGCRSNTGCDAGETCDSNGACVAPAGSVAFGGACSATEDCTAGLTCGVVTGVCGESCDDVDDPCPRCEAASPGTCSCRLVIATFGTCQPD